MFLKVESRLCLISFVFSLVECQTAFAVESIFVTVESTLALVVALSTHPVKIIISPTTQKTFIVDYFAESAIALFAESVFSKVFLILSLALSVAFSTESSLASPIESTFSKTESLTVSEDDPLLSQAVKTQKTAKTPKNFFITSRYFTLFQRLIHLKAKGNPLPLNFFLNSPWVTIFRFLY